MNVKEMLEAEKNKMKEMFSNSRFVTNDKMMKFNTTLTDKFVKMFESALTDDFSPLNEYNTSVASSANIYELNMNLKLKIKSDIDLLTYVFDNGKNWVDAERYIYNNLSLRVLANCHNVFPMTMKVVNFSIDFIIDEENITGFSIKIILKDK